MYIGLLLFFPRQLTGAAYDHRAPCKRPVRIGVRARRLASPAIALAFRCIRLAR
jgi:hypothetical protein